MVKGRRKRAPTSGSVHTRSSALNGAVGALVSPLRKESKLDAGARANYTTPETARSHARIDKSAIRITSFFSAQENGISDVKTLREMQTAELLVEDEHFNAVVVKTEEPEDYTSPMKELFKTDETPVAVPCRDPPTPHRINMPDVQTDETGTKILNGETVKKPVSLAMSPVPTVPRKPGGRGRGKLKTNSTSRPLTAEPPLGANTNHKVTEYFPVRRSVRKCKKTVLEEKQRDFEKKVVDQVEDGLQVKHFVGKGRGIVTTQEFAKGQFVVEYVGDLIDQIEAKKREAIYAQDQNTGCYMYYFQHRGQQYCVDATAESDKLGRLVNHCRNGNLVARIIEIKTVPHLVLTAKEDIPVGVEVTYDYGDRSREAIRNHPWLAL